LILPTNVTLPPGESGLFIAMMVLDVIWAVKRGLKVVAPGAVTMVTFARSSTQAP